MSYERCNILLVLEMFECGIENYFSYLDACTECVYDSTFRMNTNSEESSKSNAFVLNC